MRPSNVFPLLVCLASVAACSEGKVTHATLGQVCAADLSNDPNNCGACGHVCGASSACVDGRCSCADTDLFCGGTCFDAKTDADKCGSDCNAGPCAAGQYCSAGACVPTVTPTLRQLSASQAAPSDPLAQTLLATAYFSPSGWTDADGQAALVAELAELPNGFRYECQQFLTAAGVGNAPFVPCDGVKGLTRQVRLQTPSAGVQDGSYTINVRTSANATSGGRVSDVFPIVTYVHASLDGVARCSHSLTDDQIVNFVKASLTDGTMSTGGDVDLRTTYTGAPVPSFDFASDRVVPDALAPGLLRAPHITLPFKGVRMSYAMWRTRSWGTGKGSFGESLTNIWKGAPYPARAFSDNRSSIGLDFTLDGDYAADRGLDESNDPGGKLRSKPGNVTFGSLRHRFVARSLAEPESTKEIVIVRRDRPSKRWGTCQNAFDFGSEDFSSISDDYSNNYQRTFERADCDAFVVNTAGLGVCIGKDTNGQPKALRVTKFGWAKLLSGNSFSAKCFTPGCDETFDYATYLPQ